MKNKKKIFRVSEEENDILKKKSENLNLSLPVKSLFHNVFLILNFFHKTRNHNYGKSFKIKDI